MRLTRRDTLMLSMAGLAGAGIFAPKAFAQDATKDKAAPNPIKGDSYPVEGGEIVVRPIQHASLVLSVPGMDIYADPVGGPALYKGQPKPDLILITHEHSDHYDPVTLAGIIADHTRLVTNPAVFEMLPPELKERATAIGNGESTSVDEADIDAIPAYNMSPDRLKYHPKGRDNGYVLNVDGGRIYIAGDTEDTQEMRALEEIFIAFVPMNLPYTMTPEQAAQGVQAFMPEYAYPYHYRGSDPKLFAAALEASGAKSKPVLRDWYKK